MGNKYVSPSGNDGNNGLGPDASHASNKPWLTLEYAVDNMSDGDVLYVAPNIWRDVITIGVTPTTETKIVGDPLNMVGFKDGSGVLLTPGPVIVTNFLTDDVTASTNTAVIDCNGKSYLTFENLWVESGSNARCFEVAATCDHITIRRCALFCVGNAGIRIITTAGVTHSHLIESCYILGICGIAINIVAAKHTSEYDIGITFRNSTASCNSSYGVSLETTGSGTYFGTGLIVQNCELMASSCIRSSSSYNATLTIKNQVKNSLLMGVNGLYAAAGSSGDVWVEDYNFILCTTPRTLVDAGAHSVAYGSNVFARAIRLDVGQSQLFGFAAKPFMSPWNTSRTIGYGNDSTPTALTVDIWDRVRPSGSGVAAASVLASVGAHELHEYGVKDTATKDAGDASLKLVGPGDHEFLIPVAAAATTLSIKARYDSSTYGGTNYPQAILYDAAGFANISGNTETLTATNAASDAWQTLTFTQFTPSRKGTIRLRLVNRGSGADDICWFDTLGIA